MANKLRIAVAALSISGAALVGLFVDEHYTDNAVIPTKNDRPTFGFGSTFKEDGSPVKMGDKITPVRAVKLAHGHITQEESKFRASIPNVALYQAEYDIYMDWIYQYGSTAWQRSTMRSELLRGNYVGACNALLRYKYSGGYDCSVPGNKVCAGVWTRQLERHKKCMEAQ
jgi:lysozyme